MNNLKTRPSANLLALLKRLPREEQDELNSIAQEIKRMQGPYAAREWLTQQLAQTAPPDSSRPPAAGEPDFAQPPPLEIVRRPPTPFERAFAQTQSWSQEVTRTLGGVNLLKGAFRLYRHLHHYACANLNLQSVEPTADQHVLFTVAEAVYDILGISRASYYRYIGQLEHAGLIDSRGHYTTVETHGSRSDGTLFAIKLHPSRQGNAHLPPETLFVQDYRNLNEDIQQERTYFKLRQSSNGVINTLTKLLGWIHTKCKSLPGNDLFNPRISDCLTSSKTGLETVLHVTQGTSESRGRRLTAAVQATISALGDQYSKPFWWVFFDKLAALAEGGGKDYAVNIQLALERERIAKAEGFARNPAALFVARLKASGVYAEIMT